MRKSKLFALFDVTGTANLSLKNGLSGPVYFRFTGEDGHVPVNGEVAGDVALLDAAWHAGRATVAMLDTTFDVKVLGRSNTNGTLVVDSAPLFRALAVRAKNAA
jgi:microcompartment protein CcmL/EutN